MEKSRVITGFSHTPVPMPWPNWRAKASRSSL